MVRESGESSAPPSPTRKRALIIDDSESVRSVIRSALEEESVDVAEAKDGADGLKCLLSDPQIGLVFLDVHMPGMDGFETLRRIRAEPSLAGVSVILITGESASMTLATDLGAAGVLQKPLRYESLARVAQNFLP